jgi:hypothetical protein
MMFIENKLDMFTDRVKTVAAILVVFSRQAIQQWTAVKQRVQQTYHAQHSTGRVAVIYGAYWYVTGTPALLSRMTTGTTIKSKPQLDMFTDRVKTVAAILVVFSRQAIQQWTAVKQRVQQTYHAQHSTGRVAVIYGAYWYVTGTPALLSRMTTGTTIKSKPQRTWEAALGTVVSARMVLSHFRVGAIMGATMFRARAAMGARVPGTTGTTLIGYPAKPGMRALRSRTLFWTRTTTIYREAHVVRSPTPRHRHNSISSMMGTLASMVMT